MTGPRLEIPVEELSTILNKAILDSLSEQTKANLVEAALKYLLTEPERDRYGHKTDESPLQKAFNFALNRLAHEVADEVLAAHGARDKMAREFQSLYDNMPSMEEDYRLQQAVMEAVLRRAREIKDGEY